MSNLNSWTNEEYLEKKVRFLVEPIIASLLIEKPVDPVSIIFKFRRYL